MGCGRAFASALEGSESLHSLETKLARSRRPSYAELLTGAAFLPPKWRPIADRVRPERAYPGHLSPVTWRWPQERATPPASRTNGRLSELRQIRDEDHTSTTARCAIVVVRSLLRFLARWVFRR